MFERYPSFCMKYRLPVRIGEQEWPENQITASELFAKTAEIRQHPITSQPSPGEFINLFTPLVKDGNKVLIITMSGELSGTYQGAKSAAKIISAQDMILRS